MLLSAELCNRNNGVKEAIAGQSFEMLLIQFPDPEYPSYQPVCMLPKWNPKSILQPYTEEGAG